MSPAVVAVVAGLPAMRSVPIDDGVLPILELNMPDPKSFAYLDQITLTIRDQVAEITQHEPLVLPAAQSALVESYIVRTEGAYSVASFKGDTEHAIDLLVIAYNVTPHDQAEIRIQIDAIMKQLKVAQQDSEHAILQATAVAEGIHARLDGVFSTWLKARNDGQQAIIRFLSETMLALGEEIQHSSAKVREDLHKIAERYDRILVETRRVNDASQAALGKLIAGNEALLRESQEGGERQRELDTLLAEMAEEVRRYEQRATQAEVAMSELLCLGVPLVSSVLPLSVFNEIKEISLLAASRLCGACRDLISGDAFENAGIDTRAIVRQHIGLLEKVSAYEKHLGLHEDGLDKITTLLMGCCRQQKSAEFAFRAFNLSLGALARNKEIIEEMAFFFSSFADLMQAMLAEAQLRFGIYKGLDQQREFAENKLHRLMHATDALFIEQAAQWLAVHRLAGIFAQTFNSSWRRLNSLSALYLPSDEFDTHLEKIIKYLADVAEQRQQRRQMRNTQLEDRLRLFRSFI